MKKQFYLSVAMMHLLLRFLRQGTHRFIDPFDARRIFLLNLFFGVASLAMAGAMIQSFVTDEPTPFHIALAVGLVLITGVPFLARRSPDLGAIYLIFVSNLIVLFFSNSEGMAAGTYFFYFPLFFANGWLMDFRKPLSCVLLVSITVLGVIATLAVPESIFGFVVTKNMQETSFRFNIIAAAVIMAINTLVIVWMNYKRQLELETRIDERERASSQLTAALKEKEILLAEIHHRVKNNLAVVRGLLNMQMNTTTNEIARATLRESVNRVSTMALIHQKLYSRENPGSIDFGNYVNELVREISTSYMQQNTLMPAVNTDVKDITLTLNRAVPCGLILNELLTNAFKHAFRSDQRGVIDIRISHDAARTGYVNMIVSDNGNGIPAGFNPETTPTLGITIIQSLSEQLDGDFTYGSSASGTEMRVSFPIFQAN